MGRWSSDLFGSDAEMDLVEELTSQLECELYKPQDIDRARAELEKEDKLAHKLDELMSAKLDHVRLFRFYGIPLTIIVLVACAISCGAKLSVHCRVFVKTMLEKLPKIEHLYPNGRKKFERALEKYKDGEPINLFGPTLGEAAAERFLAPRVQSDKSDIQTFSQGFVLPRQGE